MGVYSVHLVGESNYQAAVRRLRPGETVTLEPEPENKFDPRAIRAVSPAGETIGYIERDSWISRAMLDEGTQVAAQVETLIGGEPGKPSVGVILSVATAADAAAPRPQPPKQPADELAVKIKAIGSNIQSCGCALTLLAGLAVLVMVLL